MNVDILWDELRKKQLKTVDKSPFEKYDRQFLQAIVSELNKYKVAMLTAANITESEYATLQDQTVNFKNLNQMQLALLYHAQAIDRFHLILYKLLDNLYANTTPCQNIDNKAIWSKLPKLDIAKEFINNNIPRYGEFLATLQITNPDIFRAQNLIAQQAQHEFALNIFHMLRNMFPKILSSQGLANHIDRLFKDLLDKSHVETAHHTKFENLWLYLKQATRDTSLNIIFDLLKAMNLDMLIAKKFTHFLVSKTDEVNEDALLYTIVELTELSETTKIQLPQDYFKDYINRVKKQRYNDLEKIIDSLTRKISLADTKIQDIKNLLEHIKILTPLEKTITKGLKKYAKIQEKLLFNQKNVVPIIEQININLKTSPHNNQANRYCKTKIEKLITQLKSLLSYQKQLIENEAQEINNQINKKMHMAALYPDVCKLSKAISETNQLITNNTQVNILGIKIKNKTAKALEIYRRELFYLLRDKINICLKNSIVPESDQWDYFFKNKFNSPLHKDTSWQNFFFSFTALGANPRFPGLLSDQLNYLYKIIQIKECIHALIYNNQNTLPIYDATELNKDKIVGTKHLYNLYAELQLKEQKLGRFILYLQFTSINAILNQIKHPSKELNKIKAIITSCSDTQKMQAQQPPYFQMNFIKPKLIQLKNAFEQLKELHPDEFKKITSYSDSVIDTIDKITNFYFGDNAQKQQAATVSSREFVQIKELSFLRNLVLVLLDSCQNLYNNIFEPIYEFFHSIIKPYKHRAPENQEAQTPVIPNNPDKLLSTPPVGSTKHVNQTHCVLYRPSKQLQSSHFTNLNLAANTTQKVSKPYL